MQTNETGVFEVPAKRQAELRAAGEREAQKWAEMSPEDREAAEANEDERIKWINQREAERDLQRREAGLELAQACAARQGATEDPRARLERYAAVIGKLRARGL